ncbi:predicted protein [Naegleria gruberi]|uniref:Predicted protein n=1 Tax=Naegleria gruberi TaxID=5762 RepID=D2V6G9_NAEGR|nr:uncharacterized protein NAEGRDRAFT_47059 [Naegleria gruberi]EFC47444.1 predicted protein [Naegleria gruberi]|eukprot:XP_002680188.1 predicted protein [Naegleria gruberi strain NEG-M]
MSLSDDSFTKTKRKYSDYEKDYKEEDDADDELIYDRFDKKRKGEEELIATIGISSVSHQFRRVWKETPNGIVYNMIIQLNYSFKKRSCSLDDRIQVANFSKSAIIGAFIQGESSEKILSKTERFVDELSKIKDKSENFTNAISRIDRFDYGQDDKMYYGASLRRAAGFEISFAFNFTIKKMSAQESEETSNSCYSSDDEEQSQGTKRKLDDDDFISKNKKQKQTIIGVQTLGQMPDEIIEQIFDFIPNRYSAIRVSGVSQQFRRVWKKTTFGIVYNMIIELNYSFVKHSYSLDKQIGIGRIVKEEINQLFAEKEDEKQDLFYEQQADLLIEELRKKENMSENFTKALSEITRFDYGEERDVPNGVCMGVSKGMEIEFGDLGMIRFWKWDQIYVKHGDSIESGIMSESLLDLNLTEEEWNIIIETAGSKADLWLRYKNFEHHNEVGSIFEDHLLEISSELW